MSADKCEYIYRKNSFILGESVYLVRYVLDPNDQKKLSLEEAFNRLIIDDENWFYYGKKGPYALETAIQKGYIACQTIDLNLLNAIITSNIFKYSTFTSEMQTTEEEATALDVGEQSVQDQQQQQQQLLQQIQQEIEKPQNQELEKPQQQQDEGVEELKEVFDSTKTDTTDQKAKIVSQWRRNKGLKSQVSNLLNHVPNKLIWSSIVQPW